MKQGYVQTGKKSFTMGGLVAGIMLPVLIAGITGFSYLSSNYKKTVARVMINGVQSENACSYQALTSKGVFEVSNDIWQRHLGRNEVVKQLEELKGQACKLQVNGYDIPLLGMHPNILAVTPEKAAP